MTQRANGRQFILASDAERIVYLDLLRQAVRTQGVSVIGYCLMSSHVHLVVVPRRPESLAVALKQVHGRYASYWNVAHSGSGHVWQGRFFSCPLEAGHLGTALRYAERNPVRAGLVAHPTEWAWSSAAAHCGMAAPDACLDMTTWRKAWGEEEWRKFLEAGESEEELSALRRSTYTGHPLGSDKFISALEKRTARRLRPGKGGRPRNPPRDPGSSVMPRRRG